MSDTARVARQTALLAGNGFVLAQLYSLYFDSLKQHGYMRMDGALIALCIVALLGLIAAYGALVVGGKRGTAMEGAGATAFLCCIGAWLAFAVWGS